MLGRQVVIGYQRRNIIGNELKPNPKQKNYKPSASAGLQYYAIEDIRLPPYREKSGTNQIPSFTNKFDTNAIRVPIATLIRLAFHRN